MIPYDSYRYIFPPRPKNAVPLSAIDDYGNGKYLAQPKLNGDCLVLFTNGIEYKILNRHKSTFKKSMPNTDRFLKLHRETISKGSEKNKWMVLVGEYMDKGKKNEFGENFNHNLVIHDILVYDGMHLIGKTFQERVELLDAIYGKDDKEITKDGIRTWKFMHTTDVQGVYRVKSYMDCLDALWRDLIKIDMYEGLVIKMCAARLENGRSETNNHTGQVKIRKETKNYLY